MARSDTLSLNAPSVVKVFDLITATLNKGREWSIPEIMESTKLTRGSVQAALTSLHKSKMAYIKRWRKVKQSWETLWCCGSRNNAPRPPRDLEREKILIKECRARYYERHLAGRVRPKRKTIQEAEGKRSALDTALFGEYQRRAA